MNALIPDGGELSTRRRYRMWAAGTAAASGAQLLLGLGPSGDALGQLGRSMVVGTGVTTGLLALWVLCAPGSAMALAGATGDARSASRVGAQPHVTLFVISFCALFLEVLLIRYTSSQFRVFSFYKNIPLISAYLGLGIGCWIGRGAARHALAFLGSLVPLAIVLSHGSSLLGGILGNWAAQGSSEHILGNAAIEAPTAVESLVGQAGMAAFCVVTLVAFTALFALLGRLLGAAFEGLPRLTAYSINIAGSLAGIGGFLAMSYLETPPWSWILIGALPLLWWVASKRQLALALILIGLVSTTTAPSVGHTVWSRYQKLVGRELPAGPGKSWTKRPAYLIEISDVFYQLAIDLRPEALLPGIGNTLPHYDRSFEPLRGADRVLIVGAGSGNDVAAALRADVAHVDAVDIDPAIIEMGRAHHPERPYQDPRVHVIIDDARSAFGRLPVRSYDAVVFGLLDSHTQLSMSSVRLDNYVFTQESLASVRRLLKPGGMIVLTAATFRPWFRERFMGMLATSCDSGFDVKEAGPWVSYLCRVDRPEAPAPGVSPALAHLDLPSDDWPFLYLPERAIPQAYLVVVLLMIVSSAWLLKRYGMTFDRVGPFQGHMFFLGAAFLLMEVLAVNRLALLFGTTWLVSTITIGLVLLLIVLANATVQLTGGLAARPAYLLLCGALLLSFSLPPSAVQGYGTAAALAYGLFQLLPVYFAGLVFARSFSHAPLAGPAIGANMFGAVLGGWAEYSSMLLGFKAMILLALGFYVVSFWLLERHTRLHGSH